MFEVQNRDNMTVDSISQYLLKNYSGLKVIEAWSETNFFYNPESLLQHGIYFCTLKNKDGENDKASYLNRDNIFRFSFGIPKKTFTDIFTSIPKRPMKGHIIEGSYNFQDLNILNPHPIYGWMSWVCILNPSQKSFENLHNLLDESYELCIEKYNRRLRQTGKIEGYSSSN